MAKYTHQELSKKLLQANLQARKFLLNGCLVHLFQRCFKIFQKVSKISFIKTDPYLFERLIWQKLKNAPKILNAEFFN